MEGLALTPTQLVIQAEGQEGKVPRGFQSKLSGWGLFPPAGGPELTSPTPANCASCLTPGWPGLGSEGQEASGSISIAVRQDGAVEISNGSVSPLGWICTLLPAGEAPLLLRGFTCTFLGGT